MKTKILLLSLTLSIISCSKNNASKKPLTPFNTVEKGTELVNKNNQFTFKTFKEILKENEHKNTFFSPASLSLALGMTYNGANDATKKAFENTLLYNGFNINTINNVNKNIIQHLSDDSSGSVFRVANSIWMNKNINVKKSFIDINKENYFAEVNAVDFSKASTVNTINNWVSNKTNKKIPKIVEKIGSTDIMYLINALYFKGLWKHKFDKNLTKKETFTNKKEAKKVDMMFLEENVAYFQNDIFSSIKLPYKNDKFSMTVLLPSKNKTVNDITNALSQENWTKWNKKYAVEDVNIFFPKFKFSFSQKLNDILIKLGLGNAFSNKADFSNISDNTSSKISKVLQKTFVNVDEEGTEAAAATVVVMALTSAAPSKKIFKVNKPFLFMITEKATNSICFIGKINMPAYEN